MQSETDGRSWPTTTSYSADLYSGTAELYAAHRIPYPASLLDALIRRCRVPVSTLLDLACGTGEIAIPLSSHFPHVIAVDQEPSMVDVGRRKAAVTGAGNMTWINGTAEALLLQDNAVSLIAIGNAFHRLDRAYVARKAMRWLKPGSVIAILNTDSVWRGTEPWQLAAVNVIAKWAKPTASTSASTPRLTHAEILAQEGFQEITEEHYTSDHTWTLDGFIGYLHSTSLVSNAALGQSADEFDAELRKTLLTFEPSGRLPETARFSCLTARRPSDGK